MLRGKTQRKDNDYMDETKRLQFMRELDLKAWGKYPPSPMRILGAKMYGTPVEFQRTAGGLADTFRYSQFKVSFWDHAEYFVISREWRWEYEISVYRYPFIASLQPYNVDQSELLRLRTLCQIYHRDIIELPQWNWYGYETQFLLLAPLQWINKHADKLQYRLGI